MFFLNHRLHDYINTLKNKSVAVIGIGVSNTPLIKLLLKNGISVIACDKNEKDAFGYLADELEGLGAELRLGKDYLNDIYADVIFRTPGMHPETPALATARERGAIITSEMEVFFEVCPCHTIGITGSDGKTTTTTIISKLLEESGQKVFVGGNIGTPLLAKTEEMSPEDWAVLELSSFQLMTMKKSPEIAVVTNVAPNHLDVHKSMEEYIEAKRNILKYQNSEDKIVLNFDNDITRSFADTAPGHVSFFSYKEELQDGVCLHHGTISAMHSGTATSIMLPKNILIPGTHNVENYMAAFAALDGIVPYDIFRKVAVEFKGVEHRIELVREYNGVKYYNDSIASSPTRTIAGLKSFNQKVILIAGGKDKGVPFDNLGEEIVKRVKSLILTGFTAQKIRNAVEKAPGYNGMPPIYEYADFRDAVIAASNLAEVGDIVILSPACTSFDRFKNFAERGKYFKDIVNQL